MMYEVIVGNIGSVYYGNRVREAEIHFTEYKRQSVAGFGRAGGETVTILRDQHIYKRFTGTVDREPEDTAKWKCPECGISVTGIESEVEDERLCNCCYEKMIIKMEET